MVASYIPMYITLPSKKLLDKVLKQFLKVTHDHDDRLPWLVVRELVDVLYKQENFNFSETDEKTCKNYLLNELSKILKNEYNLKRGKIGINHFSMTVEKGKKKNFPQNYTDPNFLRVNFKERTKSPTQVSGFLGVKIRDEIWTNVHYFEDSDSWVIPNRIKDVEFAHKNKND